MKHQIFQKHLCETSAPTDGGANGFVNLCYKHSQRVHDPQSSENYAGEEPPPEQNIAVLLALLHSRRCLLLRFSLRYNF